MWSPLICMSAGLQSFFFLLFTPYKWFGNQLSPMFMVHSENTLVMTADEMWETVLIFRNPPNDHHFECSMVIVLFQNGTCQCVKKYLIIVRVRACAGTFPLMTSRGLRASDVSLEPVLPS